MLTDVKNYLEALDDAEKTLKEAVAATEADARKSRDDGDGRPWSSIRDARRSAANYAEEAAKQAAFAALLETSDPVVRWIATNVLKSYPDQARIVLEKLPATYAELVALRNDRGWCSDYDGYLRKAVRAGVIDDGRSPEERELENYLRQYVTTDRTQLAGIMDRVTLVVNARITAAAAEPQDAAAELEPVAGS